MKKTLTTVALAGAGVFLMAGSAAAAPGGGGWFDFDPLESSATPVTDPDASAPWSLPDGYTQELVSGELSDRCGGDGLNIYTDLDEDGELQDDWNDMNTVNETGYQAGRYLYRTHEVRLDVPGADEYYPEGGAVSVVDLKTCESRVIAQDPSWTALDGIVWTPWGTVLFAEETTGGKLFELVLDKKDPMSGTVYERPAVGLMGHEGIEVGAAGDIFVVDEYRGQSQGDGAGGGVYRFVPDRHGDLSSGTLYQLAVDDGDGSGAIGENVGQGSWVEIDAANVRDSGLAADGAAYERPEDLERIGQYLYVAITEGTKDDEGDQNYDGRVIAIDLKSLEVTDFVKPGENAPVESGSTTGFDNPDNLAHGPNGALWIVEDNVPSDIWMAQGKGGVADGIDLFASLTDAGAEGTGLYFAPGDPKTLYINVQHSIYENGDGTWAITKQR